MRSLKAIIFALCLISSLKFSRAKLKESTVLDNDEQDEMVFRKYREMDKTLKQLVNYGVKMTLPMLLEATDKMNLTAKCMGNILHLINGIRKLKLSAVSFLDASGKPSGGYLDGNMHMLGDYEECLKTEMKAKSGGVAIRGQYCLIEYTPLLPPKKRPITLISGVEELIEATRNTSEVTRHLASLAHFFYYYPAKYGLCVPSGCNEEDVSQIVTLISAKIYFNASLVYCDSDSDVFLVRRNIGFISLFALLGLLAVIGSFVEYYSWKDIRILKYFLGKFFCCFSILKSFPKAISATKSENDISCLHGIRALSLFYVILLHQYYAITKHYTISHVMISIEDISKFSFQIIANGFLISDVFFFLGGLVNCYTRVKLERNKKRSTTLLFVLLHRLNRIGPVYLLFCFFTSLLKPSGPMRIFSKTQYDEKCLKYWWQNILFINNFFFQDDTCEPHTWFLAVDMQLFIVSLLTVPLFYNRPKKGFIVNAAIICIGISTTVIWSWIAKLTPGVVVYRPNAEEINKAWNAHSFTFPHIAPYFTGILMGYYLAVRDSESIKIPKMYQVIGWPVAAILFLSMLFMTKVWNSGGAYTVVDSAFYFGFSKFVFILGVSWMVFCCATGNGGIINYILSLPLWIPISRISFGVYLLAPFLQIFYYSNSKAVVDGHKMPLIWRYAGDTLISCLFGIVLYILIQSPFLEMEKLLFHRQPPLREEIVKPDDIRSNGTSAHKKAHKDETELNHNGQILHNSC